MEIGSKIKKARNVRGMTQAALCGDYITRNMLSAIENNRALPSLTALEYFVERLEISASYFFSCDSDPTPYMAEYKMPRIRKLFEEGKYTKVLEETEEYQSCMSNELKLITASSLYNLGQKSFNQGNLNISREYYQQAQKLYLDLQVMPMYDNCQTALKVIASFSSNSLPSPFECFRHNKHTPDFVLYLYILYMIDHGMADRASTLYDIVKFEYQPFRYHINSRLAAAKFNYHRAKELLYELIFREEMKMPVPFMISVINELEDYCLKTGDYKTAYDCTVVKSKFMIDQ